MPSDEEKEQSSIPFFREIEGLDDTEDPKEASFLVPGRDPESYSLDFINDTLQDLDASLQGAFYQKFLQNLTGVVATEEQSSAHWKNILERRRDLMRRLGRWVSLRTAAVDYCSTEALVTQPVLLEYRSLRRLRLDAARDPLTGLANRRFFEIYLERELARSKRYGFPLTLLILDLHNFKQVNDRYGHSIGDEVLRLLSRLFKETLRASDYACRIGGDEFALILPQAEPQSLRNMMQRMVKSFADGTHPLAPDTGLALDYGESAYPRDGDSATALFRAADQNLYTERKKSHPETGPSAEPTPIPQPQEPVIADQTATPKEERPNPRRHERLSLEKTQSYGELQHTSGRKQARVLDLSFGGVAFLLDEPLEVPEQFYARLHVPVLPEADFKLQRVYTQRLTQNFVRLGCRFLN